MQSGIEDYYQDTTDWLKGTVLQKPYRDVEPVEYLYVSDWERMILALHGFRFSVTADIATAVPANSRQMSQLPGTSE